MLVEGHRPREVELKPQEACGVFGITSTTGSDVATLVPRGINLQQHRGYDSAGIGVSNFEGELAFHTGPGLAQDVFPEGFDFKEKKLSGPMAIGSNRYGTSELNGDKDHISGAMPVTSEYGEWSAGMVYNGNLPDGMRRRLRSKIPADLLREHSFDSQDIIDALVSAPGESWPDKFRATFHDIPGALSIIVQTKEKQFAYRGETGTWPLWLGKVSGYLVLASETRVERIFDGEVEWKEVAPGELIEIDRETAKLKSRQIIIPRPEILAECSLHAMYNARPDSTMTITPEGKRVTYGEFRGEAGRELARENPNFRADVYVPVPNTGNPIAEAFAAERGTTATYAMRKTPDERLPKGEEIKGFIQKNGNEAAAVLDRYEVEGTLIGGLKVAEFDDSLIKGLTAGGEPDKRGTIRISKDGGATGVHAFFAMPKFVEGCDMGVVIRKNTLIAVEKQGDGAYVVLSDERVAEKIGADSVRYLSVSGLKAIYERTTGKPAEHLCLNCVGGGHPLEMNEAVDVREPILVA